VIPRFSINLASITRENTGRERIAARRQCVIDSYREERNDARIGDARGNQLPDTTESAVHRRSFPLSGAKSNRILICAPRGPRQKPEIFLNYKRTRVKETNER